ncbi:Uma2 family endonuclease [Anabaena sp. UHCC 0399]|uniref:Uma2 family endonuclease n=1 Tax=Anabaena sp. UHCC 0399 TaxID=3110238 RepID=UPI002B20D279|nr:Uma2 family endonuclease [Anabaena sp. UHCC 0399]MEA5565525.1 Uma2 family endonuclease [Anabaena sp. UHCC 0399]
MLLELKRIYIPPGQKVLLRDVTWQELETILEDLGEHRAARIAYDRGILEIMSPLPEHEDNKEIISDLVKALLEELGIEFRCLGSTTFKNQFMAQGIEPDQCFYITNESKIRGKKRLDLTVDPPPDLALEIDITSRTHTYIYQSLKVPELWRFENGKLQINILHDDIYIESQNSLNFPQLPLIDVMTQYLDQSKIIGRNTTLKNFRIWVREQIQIS